MPEAMIQLLFTDSYCIFFTVMAKLEVKRELQSIPSRSWVGDLEADFPLPTVSGSNTPLS